MRSTYTNPVGDGLIIGDPFVLWAENRYHLFGTTDPGKGFRVHASTDLVHWTSPGFAYEGRAGSWAGPPYWAPEVRAYQGRYYMTYSARDARTGRLLTALAVSGRPAGPYEDLHAPWFDTGDNAIDAHLFVDHDGTPFLYYSRNGHRQGHDFGEIHGAPLFPDLSRFAADPILLLTPDQPWERVDWARNRCNEGPFVLHEEGFYYMTYAANHTFRPGYGIGCATSRHPLGPWRKSPDNPLAGSDLVVGYAGAGHPSIVASPDGRERFLVYHTHEDPAHPENERRTLNIDRLELDRGRMKLRGPTRTPQPLPSGAPAEDLS
jgi:beta-xylosidase